VSSVVDTHGSPTATGVSRAGWSDSYRYSRALIVLLFLIILDYTNYLGGEAAGGGIGARYVLLFIPVGSVFLSRTLHREHLIHRPSFPDALLIVLSTYAVLGAIWGKVALGTHTSALPMFASAVVAIVYLAAMSPQSDEETTVLLRLLLAAGVVDVCIHAVASSGLVAAISNADPSATYRHPRAFLIAMALATAVVLRRWVIALILGALTAFIVAKYPAATYIATAFTAGVVLFATRPKVDARRVGIIVGLLAIFVVVVAVNFGKSIDVVQRYFTDVGKQSNVQTRLDFWTFAIRQIGRSPLLGSMFRGEMAVPVRLLGASGPVDRIPLHNDYLQIAYGGGIVALALFLGWAVATNVHAFRRYRVALEVSPVKAQMIRVLLVGYDAWLVVALFNPLLLDLSLSTSLFIIYGLMMTVAVSIPSGSEGAVQVGGTRSIVPSPP
jgi:O-antigen ligase